MLKLIILTVAVSSLAATVHAGIFDQLKEEKNIRANPLARTSDLLQKVFGSVAK